MGTEFKFTVPKCGSCGVKLSGKHAELAGMKGSVPMGCCPKCGTAYQIVEIKSEPEPESEPKPETKPIVEPPEPKLEVKPEVKPEVPAEEPPKPEPKG